MVRLIISTRRTSDDFISESGSSYRGISSEDSKEPRRRRQVLEKAGIAVLDHGSISTGAFPIALDHCSFGRFDRSRITNDPTEPKLVVRVGDSAAVPEETNLNLAYHDAAVPFQSLLQMNVPHRHSDPFSFSPDGPSGRGQM